MTNKTGAAILALVRLAEIKNLIRQPFVHQDSNVITASMTIMWHRYKGTANVRGSKKSCVSFHQKRRTFEGNNGIVSKHFPRKGV